MNEIDSEIDSALRAHAELAQSIRMCDSELAKQIVSKAMAAFVSGNPRTWWLSLNPKVVCRAYDYPDSDGFEHIAELIPSPDQTCWFIPETEETDLPVFDCEVRSVKLLMRQCFFFEYYLVGKRFDWLAIDTDHNQIIIVSALNGESRDISKGPQSA